MSITDELRKWVMENVTNVVLTSYPPKHEVRGTRESLLAIADRIDAEHESACGEAYGNGVQSVALPDMTAYIKLPKDADGVPIRVGDVMEFSAFEIEKPVTRMVDGIGQGVFFAWCGERGYQQHEAKRYRHHHTPTVEDVLREMHAKLDEVTALYVGEAIDSDERDSDEARIFAEYAEKLRLAGDAE